MALKPITVSQLNEYLSRIVSTDPLLGNVTVKGEASGVKYHSSGHVYFAIVDEDSRLSCFLPKNYARELPFQLKDGSEVILSGGISIYKKGGSYSLYVRHIEMQGEGTLAIAFEQMKQRLDKEGLFDPAHKKPLPVFPRRIGVVTSSTGAAVRDILKTIRLRNDVVDVTIYPAPVQGEGAGDKIAQVIDLVNEKFPETEILIVGRGGGSAEDLWAFNEEAVARSIYRSAIPVVSAVGHEIDFTISDMVADVRAATPTAAAQIAVPDTGELLEEIRKRKQELLQQLQNKVMYQSLIAENLAESMRQTCLNRIDSAQQKLEAEKRLLEAHDPRAILSLGYAIAETEDGTVVTDSRQLAPDDQIRLQFRTGAAAARITEVRGDEE